MSRKLVRLLAVMVAVCAFPLLGILVAQGVRGSALLAVGGLVLFFFAFFAFLADPRPHWMRAAVVILSVLGTGAASAEASLHLTIARVRGAGAVLHTHSIWSTILSDASAADGGLGIEGYEMLKGLEGVYTHEHREWLPILDNSQNWLAQTPLVERTLIQHADAHGFLLRGHGLYTWGRDLSEAKRQVEVLEFLLEVTGRKRGIAWQP
jgi:hypothetical protein